MKLPELREALKRVRSTRGILETVDVNDVEDLKRLNISGATIDLRAAEGVLEALIVMIEDRVDVESVLIREE